MNKVTTSHALGPVHGVFTPEEVQIAREAIVGAAKATKTVRERVDGVICYVDKPDFPTRIVASKIIIETERGKPVAMSVTANLTPGKALETEGEGFMQSLMADPDARIALRETLRNLEEMVEKRESVEVATSPVLPESPNRTSEA